MAKILISPLGAGKTENGKYVSTFYRIGDTVEETTFISSVMTKHINFDKIFFIGTSKSMWDEIYKYFQEKSQNVKFDKEYYDFLQELREQGGQNFNAGHLSSSLKELEGTIDSYLKSVYQNAEGGSKIKIIKYGRNDSELTENMDLLMQLEDKINNKDEIYIDITHSFRSIPIFLYVIMDLLQTVSDKDIKIKGVYYGMYALTEEDIKQVPIVDISQVLNISKWDKAAENFIKYGDGKELAKLTKQQYPEISEMLLDISESLSINDIREFNNQINDFMELLNSKQNIISPPFKYIYPYLKKFAEKFSTLDKYESLLEFVLWFTSHNRKCMAYIALCEAYIAIICKAYGKEPYKKNKKRAKAIFNSKNYNKIKEENLRILCTKMERVNQIRKNCAHTSAFIAHKVKINENIIDITHDMKKFYKNDTFDNLRKDLNLF
jgi:CRISPR-associated Csx2 family protein